MARSGAITYFYSLEQVLPKGGSILFVNSNNNSITFPPSSDWAVGTGDFTVEFFAYQTNNGNENFLFDLGTSDNLAVAVASGGNKLNVYANGTKVFNPSITGTTNTWRHYAISRKSSVMYIYEGGTLVVSGANSTNIVDSTSNFYIGCENPATPTADAWPVNITNFRFVKGTGLYNTSTITVPTKPLRNITNTKLLLNAGVSSNFLYDSSIYNKVATNSGTTFSTLTPF